ncbi:MAG: hypothetical protein KC978_08080 [Candidatus Omnitrophica bacterium]|nr:hypothetical protein [Candidatus Omnitrophota bacterium]
MWYHLGVHLETKPHPMIFLGVAYLLMGVSPASACEPIVVWVVLAGPQFLNLTLASLVVVVAVKCFSFSFFEKGLPMVQRPLFMLVGNLASSVVGLAVALPLLAPAEFSLVVSLVALFGLSTGPTRRLKEVTGWRDANSGVVLISLMLAIIATAALFGLAVTALDSDEPLVYWALKLGYIAVGLAISLFVTVIFEEWVIWGMSDRANLGRNFYPSVLKANLAAFLVGGGIGAGIMLPERLRSPNFLVDIVRSLHSVSLG